MDYTTVDPFNVVHSGFPYDLPAVACNLNVDDRSVKKPY